MVVRPRLARPLVWLVRVMRRCREGGDISVWNAVPLPPLLPTCCRAVSLTMLTGRSTAKEVNFEHAMHGGASPQEFEAAATNSVFPLPVV